MKKICLVTCFAVVLAWALQPAVHAQSSDPQFQELLRKIDGRRYTCHGMTPTCPIADGATMVIDVRESVLVLGIILPDSGYKAWGPNEGHWKIENRKSTYPLPRPRVSLPPGMTCVEYTFTISEDGDRTTWRERFDNGVVRENILFWQR